jgi:6-phosphofructokinase
MANIVRLKFLRGIKNKLSKENKSINVVGVPKTIDNDLNATDYTFGFDTAVNTAITHAVSRTMPNGQTRTLSTRTATARSRA